MKVIKREMCGKCKLQTVSYVYALFDWLPGAQRVIFDDGCPGDDLRKAKADNERDEREMARIAG